MLPMWKKLYLPILISFLSGTANLGLQAAELALAATTSAKKDSSVADHDLERILTAALDEFSSNEPVTASVSPCTNVSPTKSPETLGATPDSLTIQVPTRVTASPSAGLAFPGKPLVPLTTATSAKLTKLVHQQMRYLARERNANIDKAVVAYGKRLSRPFTNVQIAQLARYRQQLESRHVLPELETFAHITSTGEMLFALVPVAEKAKVEEFALLPTEQTHKAHFIAKLRERYGRFNPPLELLPPQRGVIKVIPGWSAGEWTRK